MLFCRTFSGFAELLAVSVWISVSSDSSLLSSVSSSG